MTTDQPSFLTRPMLEAERDELSSSLSRALDRVLTWTGTASAEQDFQLEHELADVRYYATCLRTVEKLLLEPPF